MMLEVWMGLAHAVAGVAEVRADADMMKRADTPEKVSAVLKHIKDREDHRKAMQVARASAPVVNVNLKQYYW